MYFVQEISIQSRPYDRQLISKVKPLDSIIVDMPYVEYDT
jgi:hypothetical protein